MGMANNIYKTLGANAQTLTILATVCLEDPVTQEKAKTLLDKALAQRPDYTKAVVKMAELLSMYMLNMPSCCPPWTLSHTHTRTVLFLMKVGNRNTKKGSRSCVAHWPTRVTVSCTGCWETSWWLSTITRRPWTSTASH